MSPVCDDHDRFFLFKGEVVYNHSSLESFSRFLVSG